MVAEDRTAIVCFGEAGWRERYYELKLGIAPADAARRRAVCASYVKGLCWVLRYYYQGVPSWTWFYAHHYAPPASDLIGAPWDRETATAIIRFELGEPFSPLEQLTAVLPPLSSAALPPPLAALMTSPASPLADCFPATLKLDLNGANANWKAVVLLPFLDARRLRAAFEQARPSLTPEDHGRNRFGPTYLYVPPADPLASELWQLARAHAGADGYAMAKVVRPVSADESLGALVTPYPSVPEGARRDAPCAALPPVEANRVASCVMRLPPARLHTSDLLPGVSLPQTLHPSILPNESREGMQWKRSLRWR